MQACPECRKPLSEYADACPHCGRPCAEILEVRRREAEQLEGTARLCAIVMPLAALAMFCFTSLPVGLLLTLQNCCEWIVGGCVLLLIFTAYAVVLLAFFAFPILIIVGGGRMFTRCLQNR